MKRTVVALLAGSLAVLSVACGDDTNPTGGGGEGGEGGVGGTTDGGGGAGANGGFGGIGGAGGEGGTVTPIDATVISTSNDTFLEAETSVVVTQAGRIVVAWIGATFQGNTEIGYAISDDDGDSFSEPQFVTNLTGDQQGDPVLAVMADQTVLLTWLGYDIDVQGNPSNMHAFVAPLPTGDTTFGDTVEASDPLDTPQLIDKPWIAVTDAGEVVLTYARVTQDSDFALTAARSVDGIAWFQTDVFAPSPSTFINLAYVCPSVGGDRMHVVALAFSNSGLDLVSKYSDDGGATWSPRVNVAGGATDEFVNFDDPICVSSGDELTVVYGTLEEESAGKDEAGTGISMIVSSDGGDTFGEPRPIADATKGPLYLHPAIAQGDDGRISIMYYEGESDGDDEGTYVVDSPDDPSMLGQTTTPVGELIHFTARRESQQWVGDYVGLTTGPDGRWHTSFVVNLPDSSHIAYAQEP